MASRPEAAYAAAEVTPKWVLISWHHLLPPSLIINNCPAQAQCPSTVFKRAFSKAHAFLVRGRAGGPRRRTRRPRPSRCARWLARTDRHTLLWRGDPRGVVRHGLGRRSRRARHPTCTGANGRRAPGGLSRVRGRHPLSAQTRPGTGLWAEPPA